MTSLFLEQVISKRYWRSIFGITMQIKLCLRCYFWPLNWKFSPWNSVVCYIYVFACQLFPLSNILSFAIVEHSLCLDLGLHRTQSLNSERRNKKLPEKRTNRITNLCTAPKFIFVVVLHIKSILYVLDSSTKNLRVYIWNSDVYGSGMCFFASFR